MSRFYRDLHDRELLAQASSILQEVQERKLLDVILPSDASMADEDSAIFPRRLASVSVHQGRLCLMVEQRFFQTPKRGSSAH